MLALGLEATAIWVWSGLVHPLGRERLPGGPSEVRSPALTSQDALSSGDFRPFPWTLRCWESSVVCVCHGRGC